MELLKVEGLTKHFETKKAFGTGRKTVRAVNGVDFSLGQDSVLALVGESGCGKSTVARIVLRLLEPTSGSVLFRGEDVFRLEGQGLKSFRKSVQIIFQDPFASLNPRRTVFETISEPLMIHRLVARRDVKDAVVRLLGMVGLGSDIANRYPHEFSGGQRQRICIARALAVSPEIIVADEPLSALDVSIQAQILNLLQDLKRQSQISFLFISHDLRVVRYFSDRIAIMYLGKIVEFSATGDLFKNPFHPYTEVLLASAPKIKTGEGPEIHAAPLKGDVPSPVHIPPGCPFHPRCPKRFDPCDKRVPLLQEKEGRLVSCHLWD